MKSKRKVVAVVRMFQGTTDPSPYYEISFMKNVRAGQRLIFDTVEEFIYKEESDENNSNSN